MIQVLQCCEPCRLFQVFMFVSTTWTWLFAAPNRNPIILTRSQSLTRRSGFNRWGCWCLSLWLFMPLCELQVLSIFWSYKGNVGGLSPFFSPQIFVISQAEPRLPLQLEDAVRPDGEGEEVRMDETAWKVYFTHNLHYWHSQKLIFSTVPTSVKYWLRPKADVIHSF